MLSTEAPTEALFGVQRDLRDGFVRLFVRGELDLLTAPLIEDELASLEHWSDRVVVDLSDLSFMDASGLCSLAGREETCHREGSPVGHHPVSSNGQDGLRADRHGPHAR